MSEQEEWKEGLELFLKKWGIKATRLSIIIGRDKNYVTRYASGKRKIPKSFMVTLHLLENYMTKKGFSPGEAIMEVDTATNSLIEFVADRLGEQMEYLIKPKKGFKVTLKHTTKMYRPHRGSLAESMKESTQVSGLKDIIKMYPEYKNVTIDKKSKYDDRISWDTHYVLADTCGVEQQCIGMCNFYEEMG